jgi:hypothetical protein
MEAMCLRVLKPGGRYFSLRSMVLDSINVDHGVFKVRSF